MIAIAAHKNYSDLSFFKYAVNKDSVFKNPSILDFSYVPDELFERNDIINALICSFKRILTDKTTSTNCLLLGPAGTGKTTIAKFFANNFRIVTLAEIPVFYTEYLNCMEYRSVDAIVRQLIKNYCHGSGKGYGSEEAWLMILRKLVYSKAYLFVILDNIEFLAQDDFLKILCLSESFGHQNVRISFFFISRNRKWDRYKNQEMIQRLYNLIKIEPYTEKQAYIILSKKCELAFKENIIREELLETLARIVAERKNMRYGIDYLRKLGIYADHQRLKQITVNLLKEIPLEPYYEYIEILERLKDHELLAYAGVLYSLINSETTTVEKSYIEYNKLCEIYNQKAHHIRTFGRYIRALAKLNLIIKELKHYPIPGGGYDEISLSYNSNGIKKEVESYLKQKLG